MSYAAESEFELASINDPKAKDDETVTKCCRIGHLIANRSSNPSADEGLSLSV